MRPSRLIPLAAAILAAQLAHTQQTSTSQPAATQPETSRYDRQMIVSPARAEDSLAASQRADVFAFSRHGPDLRDENAAPYYLHAIAWLQRSRNEERDALIEGLEKVPILELDEVEARKQLAEHGQLIYELCEPAASRTWADWGVAPENGLDAPVPWVDQLHFLARRMALEARVQAVEGRFAGSGRMLRAMFILANHLGRARQTAPVLGYRGTSVANRAIDAAAQIAQLPDAPNRYWALTTLPSPMFDVPDLIDCERRLMWATLPAFTRSAAMSPEEWRNALLAMRSVSVSSEHDSLFNPLFDDAAVAKAFEERAAPYLRQRGYTDQQIRGLGAHGAMAAWFMEDYKTRFDMLAKLAHLPFHEAYPRLLALQNTEQAQPAPALLAQVMLPSFTRILAGPCNVYRQIAALRIVEAVRDHAAGNGGHLPESLEELRLPVPFDPATGKAFEFSLDGDVFTITAPRYDEADIHSGFVWQVTLRR